MGRTPQWLSVERKRGVTTYEFVVQDADKAFAAVRDVPTLLTTTAVSLNTSSGFNPLVAYASTGLIARSSTDRALQLTRVAGEEGAVGAQYTYRIALDPSGEKTVVGHFGIAEIVDEVDHKGFVFSKQDEARNLPSSGLCVNPTVLKAESTLRIDLNPSGARWRMKLSYDGVHPIDQSQVEGRMNYFGSGLIASIFCPCCLPCIACAGVEKMTTLNKGVEDQLWQLKEYCNTYGETPAAPPVTNGMNRQEQEDNVRAPRKAGGNPEEEGEVQVAVAVTPTEESGDVARVEALAKWHQLYKSGAITVEEFEREKDNILKNM